MRRARRAVGCAACPPSSTYPHPSVPIPPELPDLLRTDIEYSDHAAGAAGIQALFGVGPELLRDGEGWAVETFLRFGTHNSTHVDAPWHYNSTIQGERAQTIDELPLGLVLRARRRRRRDRPRRRRGADRGRCPGAPAAPAAAARHRARAVGPRRVLRPARLHGARPRRHRRGDPLDVRAGRPRDGDRRLGLGRAAAHAGRAREGGGPARDLLGGAPGGPPVRADRAALQPGRAAGRGLHGVVLPASARRWQRGARAGCCDP